MPELGMTVNTDVEGTGRGASARVDERPTRPTTPRCDAERETIVEVPADLTSEWCHRLLLQGSPPSGKLLIPSAYAREKAGELRRDVAPKRPEPRRRTLERPVVSERSGLSAVARRAKAEVERRDGRVAEGARLESVCRGNSTEGSNPSLSAIRLRSRVISRELRRDGYAQG